jgi:hypothetical protein
MTGQTDSVPDVDILCHCECEGVVIRYWCGMVSGEQGLLDSVPDELGANPHPHNKDTTRQRWCVKGLRRGTGF